MAKFSKKDIFFKDGDMAVFGTDQDSKLLWDGASNELCLTTTISGVTPSQSYHLTTKQYVDSLTSISGVMVRSNGTPVAGSPFFTLNFKSCELEVTTSGIIDILPKFGSWYGYTMEEGQTDTSSTAWIEKATFSGSGTAIGIYRVGWYYEWQYTNTNRDFQARVQLNDNYTLAEHQQEPNDKGTDQWTPASGFTYVYLSTGNNHVDLDFRSSSTGDTARIRRTRIEFWREA